MVQQVEAEPTIDKCETEGCEAAAVFSYRWEWGATGKCCAEHGALLQQTSESLKRSVNLHPLVPPAPPPLTRDERIQLTARSMVLEAELNESQSRGLELHRKNGDLQVQLSTATVKERELKAQLSDMTAQLNAAQKEQDRLSSENGRLLVELERLQHLDAFVSERAQREAHDRGLEDVETPTVVDG